ncbi:Serine/threonine-protein phosphatase [Podospora conica]|nr:Serine/threonine-protein phosphatase [Schizothecium conicum]
MAPALGLDARQSPQHTLLQLAAAYGVREPDRVAFPVPGPTPRTPHDDQLAEELLKKRRQAEGPDRSSQGSIKRAFGSSRKTWDSKEIFNALDAHVSNGGAPAVADALIAKLLFAGGDLNLSSGSVRGRTSLLTRRKSFESMERSRILQKAIHNRQSDMVAMLVDHADGFTIDAALPDAMRSSDPVILQMLLQHTSNSLQSGDAKDAFRQMCIMGGHGDLVGLILQSNARPEPTWLSMCMVDATRKGCLDTVARLSRSNADGDYNNAEALKTAIALCRVDIALAILTGAKPPRPGSQGLAESFLKLFEHPTIDPNMKMAFTEALLCAGATGDAVSAALIQASQAGFYDLVDLLVTYGASVEFRDALVVRQAVSKGQSSLVQLLLAEHSVLSPLYASDCVCMIPKKISPEDRHALLSVLLRKGAKGPALHDALIDAVKAMDLYSIELLVIPQFPGAQPISSSDVRNGARGYEMHDTASVDYKNGLALGIAVRMNSLPMVKLLLAGRPSPPTLDLVFPQLHSLPPMDRYYMAECFLAAGLSGPCISANLQVAIEEHPPQRDERFINLLLRHNADVNINDGASILSAITIRDCGLLETLLKGNPSPQTIAAAMARALMVEDKRPRFDIVRLLINAGAGRDGPQVSAVLVQILQAKPVDTQLAALLLESGRADANYEQGAAALLAASEQDEQIFDLVCQHGRPTPQTLSLALDAICKTPPTSAKTTKVASILRRLSQKEATSFALETEVDMLVGLPSEKRTPAVVRSLLAAGADVNANKAAALRAAVRGADMQLLDLLLAASPTPTSLATALPHSVNIADPMDRLSFTQKLVEAGVPRTEANRALIYAIATHPADLPLLGLLASHADSTDGEALTLAAKKENPDVVNLLLEKTIQSYPAPVLTSVFHQATKGQDQEKRAAICKTLLGKGVTGRIVSDALVAAASDGDLVLAAILMENGASVEHQEGQAIVAASASGSHEVLETLLAGKDSAKPETLEKCFQAATQVGDLERRAGVFRLLLAEGVSGVVVDAELVSAAKFGQDGENLVALLLEYGANVDYNSGEAIWNATRSAMMGSLKMLLGINRIGEKQTRPSEATLLRALKASRKLGQDPRYQVIDWLFQAGLPASEEINTALNRAVKDEPDLRLVQLLLKHGASPAANGCESLINAAQSLQADILAVFLDAPILPKDISWAFRQAFTPETASSWLSGEGFQVAQMLLTRGAEGDCLSLALSAAIDNCGTDNDTMARRFAELLLQHKADVNYEYGLVVQKAAHRADPELIELVLHGRPNSLAVSMAFPYLFDSDLSEDETLRLVELFAYYHDGEERLDPLFSHPTSDPVIFRALTKFPRSLKILQALLDAGYYHDHMTTLRVSDDIDQDEKVSLLFWALFQPQKRVSSAIIELLIQRGAKVNFGTPLSKMTPLMLAIQAKRTDLVGTLLIAGADVDVVDGTGNTPMTMATQIGGDIGTSMMSKILAADPSKNDGSLHNAARDLNLSTMQILLDFGHDPDFPSTLHDGRTALGELCLNAADAGPLTAAQEKQMERAMTLLLNSGTDTTIHSAGKSPLLLALHSADPVPTTRALLKVGLWKTINSPSHHFTSPTNHVHSPTQYLLRILPSSPTTPQLLALLQANRATDVYYAAAGPQPPDAMNLPPDLLAAERTRLARDELAARDAAAHSLALSRANDLARAHTRILAERAALEDARRDSETEALRARAAIEEQTFAKAMRRAQAEREAAAGHEQRLLEAGLTRARLVGEAEQEWEGKRVANAKEMSSLRLREREAIERLEAAGDERIMRRLTEQKKLVQSQSALAAQLEGGGRGANRQIGYVVPGEVD